MVEQTRRNLYIVDVTGTEQKFNRSAVLINGGMNFCIVTALAFSYMSLKPLFAPNPWRCTLTKVESRLNSSKTTSFVSSANIFPKPPFCCRRQKYLTYRRQAATRATNFRFEYPFNAAERPDANQDKVVQFSFSATALRVSTIRRLLSYAILFHPKYILSSFVHSPQFFIMKKTPEKLSGEKIIEYVLSCDFDPSGSVIHVTANNCVAYLQCGYDLRLIRTQHHCRSHKLHIIRRN